MAKLVAIFPPFAHANKSHSSAVTQEAPALSPPRLILISPSFFIPNKKKRRKVEICLTLIASICRGEWHGTAPSIDSRCLVQSCIFQTWFSMIAVCAICCTVCAVRYTNYCLVNCIESGRWDLFSLHSLNTVSGEDIVRLTLNCSYCEPMINDANRISGVSSIQDLLKKKW